MELHRNIIVLVQFPPPQVSVFQTSREPLTTTSCAFAKYITLTSELVMDEFGCKNFLWPGGLKYAPISISGGSRVMMMSSQVFCFDCTRLPPSKTKQLTAQFSVCSVVTTNYATLLLLLAFLQNKQTSANCYLFLTGLNSHHRCPWHCSLNSKSDYTSTSNGTCHVLVARS